LPQPCGLANGFARCHPCRGLGVSPSRVYYARVSRMGRCVATRYDCEAREVGGREAARQGKAMRCDGRIRECVVLMSCHVCLLRPLYCLQYMTCTGILRLHRTVLSHTRTQKRSACLAGTTQKLLLSTHRVIIKHDHPSSTIPYPFQPCGVFIESSSPPSSFIKV
jgi:hypothetical protein